VIEEPAGFVHRRPIQEGKMVRRFLFLIVVVAGVLAAQDPPARVGRLNYVSGSVSFQPGGVNDWVPAAINRPLTVGDQLYADTGARAEVHIPGAAFRLGSQTAFEFMNLDDRNTQLRLSEGTLNVRVRRLNENFEVDTPNLAFTIMSPGEYRINANPDTYETYVTVRQGEGQVTGNAGTFSVHAEEQAVVSGQDGAQFNLYQAPQYDDFDDWALSRDRREDRYRSAARYVSPEMVGYEDLDQYGYWRSVPEYGRCWVPRDVPVGWAPYHEGHWAWIDPWGWSWVDDEPWGFAPFHYGRWAYFDGYWGWVPGPVAVAPVYAPALVAWVGFGGGGFSASFGFGAGPAVGWFPLGPRDVYIPAYGASQTYVSRANVTNTTVINTTNVTNVYNNYIQTNTISTANYMNRSVPGAVVAMPQNALASAQPVQKAALRVQPNQINAVKTFDPAPHVALQVASVLGHAPSVYAAVPRPAAAVVSKPVVAKFTPPPAPAPFQQRQNLLAQHPGYPIPIQQQQQIARSAPAAIRPPVRVVAQARPVTPTLTHAPAPRPTPMAPAVTQHPAAPPAANIRPAETPRPQLQRPSRPYEPPSVQSRAGQPAQAQPHPIAPPTLQQRPPVQQNQPVPQPQPRPSPQANQPYEPPAVQQRHAPTPPQQQQQRAEPQPPEQGRNRSAPQAQPNRPVIPPPQAQPRPSSQANRPYEPPAVQQRRAPATEPNRPSPTPPQAERRVQPPSPEQGRNRSAPPSKPQNQSSPPRDQQTRPAPPPPQPAPPPQERKAAPPPPERKATPPPRKDEQKKEEKTPER
jgi:hypothetical protein